MAARRQTRARRGDPERTLRLCDGATDAEQGIYVEAAFGPTTTLAELRRAIESRARDCGREHAPLALFVGGQELNEDADVARAYHAGHFRGVAAYSEAEAAALRPQKRARPPPPSSEPVRLVRARPVDRSLRAAAYIPGRLARFDDMLRVLAFLPTSDLGACLSVWPAGPGVSDALWEPRARALFGDLPLASAPERVGWFAALRDTVWGLPVPAAPRPGPEADLLKQYWTKGGSTETSLFRVRVAASGGDDLPRGTHIAAAVSAMMFLDGKVPPPGALVTLRRHKEERTARVPLLALLRALQVSEPLDSFDRDRLSDAAVRALVALGPDADAAEFLTCPAEGARQRTLGFSPDIDTPRGDSFVSVGPMIEPSEDEAPPPPHTHFDGLLLRLDFGENWDMDFYLTGAEEARRKRRNRPLIRDLCAQLFGPGYGPGRGRIWHEELWDVAPAFFNANFVFYQHASVASYWVPELQRVVVLKAPDVMVN